MINFWLKRKVFIQNLWTGWYLFKTCELADTTYIVYWFPYYSTIKSPWTPFPTLSIPSRLPLRHPRKRFCCYISAIVDNQQDLECSLSSCLCSHGLSLHGQNISFPNMLNVYVGGASSFIYCPKTILNEWGCWRGQNQFLDEKYPSTETRI